MSDPTARFWDRIAERYARQPVEDEASYQRKLAVTRGYLRPDMEVVELGCGTGSTALVHAPHVRRILAVDISANMIAIARGKAVAAGVDNVTFRRSSIAELEVPDRSVDVVLGLSILHLVEDRDAVIARVRSMLVPGGLFVTSTMCLGDGMRYFKLIAPIGRLIGLMPPLEVFTAAELEASMTSAGFEIEHRWQPARRKALFLVARSAVDDIRPATSGR